MLQSFVPGGRGPEVGDYARRTHAIPVVGCGDVMTAPPGVLGGKMADVSA